MEGDSAPLCCDTPPTELHAPLGPQHKKDVDLMERAQEAWSTSALETGREN